jgi:hypothetical protein
VLTQPDCNIKVQCIGIFGIFRVFKSNSNEKGEREVEKEEEGDKESERKNQLGLLLIHPDKPNLNIN